MEHSEYQRILASRNGKFYLPPTVLNPDKKVTLSEVESSVCCKTNGGDWLITFKGRDDKHYLSALLRDEGKNKADYEKQSLEQVTA